MFCLSCRTKAFCFRQGSLVWYYTLFVNEEMLIPVQTLIVKHGSDIFSDTGEVISLNADGKLPISPFLGNSLSNGILIGKKSDFQSSRAVTISGRSFQASHHSSRAASTHAINKSLFCSCQTKLKIPLQNTRIIEVPSKLLK